MLWVVIGLLFALWLAGLAAGAPALIHLLLTLAVVLAIVKLVTYRRPVR